MKGHLILAASIALAFTAPAFAQDPPALPPADQTPAAPADQMAPTPNDSQSMAADAPSPAPTMRHRTRHHRRVSGHNNANMALSGDEPRIVAYQQSPGMKSYPAVDHGHVPGDPPIIDHSGDQATATPTSTTVTVPPSH